MNRLRNKIAALLLMVVVGGVLSAAYLTSRIYVSDKHEYLMVLNSVAAPNVAASIGQYLDHLQNEIAVFDNILGSAQKRGADQGSTDLLQSTFKNLEGISKLDIYDREGLLASIGAVQKKEASSEDAQWIKRLRGVRSRQILGINGRLLFGTWIKDRFYLLELAPESLSEYMESVKALSVMLVSDDGSILMGNSKKGFGVIPSSISNELIASHKLRSKQAVIAKEIKTADGRAVLAAIAPVPETEGAVVLVQTPETQISEMAKAVLTRSVPVVVMILLFTITLGMIFSARLVRPIEELTEATSQIASGHWGVEIKTRARDEVGRLVKAFSKMGEELALREVQLKKANEDLLRSERLAVLGKFGAGIAHEVKNPLNSILGYAQLIQKRWGDNSGPGPGDEEVVKKYLGFIMDETRRASRIITDLLTFSRQRPPTLTPMDVSEIIDYAYEMISPQAIASGVVLSKQVEAKNLTVKMDRDQIFQVLLNLTSNSIQAMETKKPDEKKEVRLKIYSGNANTAVIEVADTGSGISEENLKKIFEPFFSTKGVGKGTGLGLSLCLGIIQQHNGKIEVESKLGEGTAFKIQLPTV